ncbi:lysosomal proton-coupled steroid conjugate and bile acid symporter SLC46A3 isoform X4 [Tursiops truncatus]|uniref:Solute carrier family 46 member 3 isoform X4 n=1 Tax=Tursiops truncatus TaxID=9739 RepID=A0A6J3QB00_TURTR|nr:solute carrier family 46 member 3 isoform X4 [Tursiops truncatus]
MKIPFVEPAICFSVFAMTLTAPLTTQYVYRRIWEETGNYSIAPDSNVSECAKNKSSPIFTFQENVPVTCIYLQGVRRFQRFISFSISYSGISPIFILYELDSPLCWDEVLIGYGSALGSVSFFSSFLGIWLFSYCMEDIHMAFIGIFTTMVGMAMTAFARTTLIMFLVRLPFLFTVVPFSVLRSMISKVVRSTEQGTMFACLAFLETLGGITAVSTFNGIYSATVAWYKGFVFLLSAVLLLIPAISLCAVKCISRNAGSYVLLIQEESSEDTSDR